MRQELLSLYVLSQILSFEHVPLTSCLPWEKTLRPCNVLKADELAIFLFQLSRKPEEVGHGPKGIMGELSF